MKMRWLIPTSTRAALCVLTVILLSMAAPAPSFAGVAVGGPTPTCGSIGHGSTSDCVRHRHPGTPDHATVKPGRTFDVQVWLHPSLRYSDVAVDVQLRIRHSDGAVGPWESTHVYRGRGGAFDT